MRKSVILLLLITFFPFLSAQTYQIPQMTFSFSGRVFGVDQFDSIPYPLADAAVSLFFLGDSTLNKVVYTDESGRYKIGVSSPKKLRNTTVKMSFAYVGMESLEKETHFVRTEFPLHEAFSSSVDSIILHSHPATTEEVVIIGELRKIFQEGDTTVFNVEAIEMPSGSVLLELVRRLPGLVYKDGKLEYNGRSIEEMRLNGESFFKNDISIALKNMPNDRLKQLRVYETPDDSLSQFSDKHLVMDMITKTPLSSTFFANASVSGKVDPFNYLVEASANRFKSGGAQFSLLGDYGTLQDPPMREGHYQQGNLGGSYSSHVKQTNYSVFPRLQRTDNHLLFYELRQENLGITDMLTETDDDHQQSQWGMSVSPLTLSGRMSNNWSWNSTLRLDYDHSSEDGTTTSTTSEREHTDGGESGWRELNTRRSQSFSKEIKRSVGWDGLLRHALTSSNSEVSFGMGVNYYDTDDRKDDQTTINYLQEADSADFYKRHIEKDTKTLSYKASTTFNHQFGKRHSWSLQYAFTINHQDMSNDYFDLTPFGDLTSVSSLPAARVDSLSYDFDARTLTHQVGAGLRFDWEKLELKLNYNSQPTSRKLTLGNSKVDKKEWLHDAKSEATFKMGQSSLYASYQLQEGLPMEQMLLAMTDMTNPLNTFSGNTDLSKRTIHTMLLSYSTPFRLRVITQFAVYRNDFCPSFRFDEQTGQRTSTIKNMNGSWSNDNTVVWDRFVGTFRTQVELKHTYNHRVSERMFTSGQAGKVETDDHRLGARLLANYSNQWMSGDILGSYSHYIRNRGVDFGRSHRNEWFLSSHLSFQTRSGFTFAPDFTYALRNGYESQVMNRDEAVLNLSVAYKFLKKLATLKLDWKDVFNQSRIDYANYDANVWSERRNSSFQGRYVLLTFSLRLNQLK